MSHGPLVFLFLPIVMIVDMEMFVNVGRLEISQLFTQGARRGHPCTLDTFQFFIGNLKMAR